MTEQEIRRIMQQNREKGCTALFDAYYNYVYAIVFRKVRVFGSREDTEECVIDVFTQVMESFPAIREGSLRSYIASAARNRALNMCRTLTAKSRQTVSIDGEDFAELADGQDVAADFEQKDLTRRVLDCIESLGQPDSAILIQRYYLGRSSGEIARALHMNPVTVRSRLHRAVKRLKPMLTKLDITL